MSKYQKKKVNFELPKFNKGTKVRVTVTGIEGTVDEIVFIGGSIYRVGEAWYVESELEEIK